MIQVIALVLGALFGAGLYIAGMTNPAKIVNFLDIAGTWDPSLIFVMGGGIPVAAIGFIMSFPCSTQMRGDWRMRVLPLGRRW